MKMDELDKLEKEVNEAYVKTIQSFQNYFQNDLKYFEIKKDVINSAKEIFENSLRLIKEERARIVKSLQGDI